MADPNEPPRENIISLADVVNQEDVPSAQELSPTKIGYRIPK